MINDDIKDVPDDDDDDVPGVGELVPLVTITIYTNKCPATQVTTHGLTHGHTQVTIPGYHWGCSDKQIFLHNC